MAQDMRRFVVAALVLEDLHAAVDRAPELEAIESREREPSEGSHRSRVDDQLYRRRLEALALRSSACLWAPFSPRFGLEMTRASCPARCSHWGLGGSRSLGLRHGPKFGRRCALFLIIVESLDEHVSSEDLREQAIHVLASGAPTDSLGRARGDGWDAAGGPVPRAETRVPCLFKQLSLTRGEHVAWEDPRPRGTRLVAPRPPAFSLRAPPVVGEASPTRGRRSAKTPLLPRRGHTALVLGLRRECR